MPKTAIAQWSELEPLKPTLDRPLFVSDMSYGALSDALSKGAKLAGTGICSGEGGMLLDEQAACSRYLYELASACFGHTNNRPEGIATQKPDLRRRLKIDKIDLDF